MNLRSLPQVGLFYCNQPWDFSNATPYQTYWKLLKTAQDDPTYERDGWTVSEIR